MKTATPAEVNEIRDRVDKLYFGYMGCTAIAIGDVEILLKLLGEFADKGHSMMDCETTDCTVATLLGIMDDLSAYKSDWKAGDDEDG